MIDLSFDVWKNILLALAVAFVISFAATPVVSSFAKKVGAIDIPDKKRHIHSHPIPRMGGLAIFLGFLLSVLLFANITPQVRGILLGAILIVVVGAIDDVMNLNAWLKFCVQIVAAVIAVLSGVIINVVSNPLLITSEQAVTIGILAVPVTILWIVGVTNSVNLIDGLDGLAGYTSVAYFLWFAILLYFIYDDAVKAGNSEYAKEVLSLCVFSASMLGGLLGYLVFNGYPAKIMMGDTGSLALGAACASVAVFSKNPLLIVTSGIMYVLSGISVILQVLYYKLTKKRIFLMAPFHHHMELSGMKETKVVLIFWIVTAICCVIAYLI